jgi:tetratricopeptide (TPR) repeat protein
MGLAWKVRESFERAAELDGSDVEILRDLLEFYVEAPGIVGGGEDKARGIVERLAQISPAEGHRARARLLRKRKDEAGAERELRKALELEPHKLSRILELASFLSHRGRHDEADELFALAARISSDAPSYLFARGEALVLAKRDPEQARELLGRYLNSDRAPDDPPPSQVRELLKKL